MGRFLPGWSWEEHFDAVQRSQLARRIVAELDARLRAAPDATLYAATVHPVLSRQLREALDAVAGLSGNLLRVARPRRSDVHVTADPDLFVRVLPVVFEFGPPEVSILAIAQTPGATPDGLADAVTRAVEPSVDILSGVVRMNFDSGDLVRIT